MAKFHIGKWIATNPGGGIRMIGFTESRDEEQEMPDGSLRVFRSNPVPITVMPIQGDDGAEVEYGREKIFLGKGEFIVQVNDNNISELKKRCKMGDIRMVDWDLHYEFLEEDAPEQIEEVIVPDEKPKELNVTPKKARVVKEKQKQEQIDRLLKARKSTKPKE